MSINKPAAYGALAVCAALGAYVPVSQAATIGLTATALTTQPPGASAPIDMWGYCETGTTCAEWAPAVVEVPEGDTSLTINLTNALSVPTSVTIAGLAQGAPTVPYVAPNCTVPSGTPLTSLAAVETAPTATCEYVFNNVRAGTYVIQSGSDPRRQVQMGLYGAVKAAYPATALYAQDPLLLFSEIDPALHGVAPDQANLMNYVPHYFLINGKAFEQGDPGLVQGAAGETVLLRLANAGLQTRAPQILGGAVQVVAEDGFPTSGARGHDAAGLLLAAGKTLDVAFTAGATDAIYQLYDRRLGLSNNLLPNGGMFARLCFGANDAPVARDDYFTYTQVDGSLDFPARGILLNDQERDADCDVLTATGLSVSIGNELPGLFGANNRTKLTALDTATGAFTINAEDDFRGVAYFTYSVLDPAGLSSAAPAYVFVSADVSYNTNSGYRPGPGSGARWNLAGTVRQLQGVAAGGAVHLSFYHGADVPYGLDCNVTTVDPCIGVLEIPISSSGVHNFGTTGGGPAYDFLTTWSVPGGGTIPVSIKAEIPENTVNLPGGVSKTIPAHSYYLYNLQVERR